MMKLLVEKGGCLYHRNKSNESSITLASKMGHLDLVKWLVIEKRISLQTRDDCGTCVMLAAENNHLNCVIWMLGNGSSLDEDSSFNNNFSFSFFKESCKEILIRKGSFNKVKTAFTTKSSRK